MRYKFLLDLNIIYDAVRGVDQYDKPDPAAGQLLRLIAQICHRLTIHIILLAKYYAHLKALQTRRPRHLEPARFIQTFLHNSAKRNLEYEPLPGLPPGVTVPREDEDLVRAALISHPIVITEDGRLHEAINSQPALELRAFTIREALDLIDREQQAAGD